MACQTTVPSVSEQLFSVPSGSSPSAFTVPSGVSQLIVSLYGGGGAGAAGNPGGTTSVPSGGGGGGAGAYAQGLVTVSAGDVCTITVGAGGFSGTTISTNGANGTVSFVACGATTFVAGGGTGGLFGGVGGFGGCFLRSVRVHGRQRTNRTRCRWRLQRRHRRHWVHVRRRRSWRRMRRPRAPGQQWWGRSCPCPMAIPIAQKLTDFANRSNARLCLEMTHARRESDGRCGRVADFPSVGTHELVTDRSTPDQRGADDLRVLQSRSLSCVAGHERRSRRPALVRRASKAGAEASRPPGATNLKRPTSPGRLWASTVVASSRAAIRTPPLGRIRSCAVSRSSRSSLRLKRSFGSEYANGESDRQGPPPTIRRVLRTTGIKHRFDSGRRPQCCSSQ